MIQEYILNKNSPYMEGPLLPQTYLVQMLLKCFEILPGKCKSRNLRAFYLLPKATENPTEGKIICQIWHSYLILINIV